MFDADPGPRLFGLPPGADFPARWPRGLRARRLAGAPPEAMARVKFTSTPRGCAPLREALRAGGAAAAAALRLVTDIGA
jgi:ATP-dependent helicase/nuclease subunit B